jgi:hypothetical protein
MTVYKLLPYIHLCSRQKTKTTLMSFELPYIHLCSRQKTKTTLMSSLYREYTYISKTFEVDWILYTMD